MANRKKRIKLHHSGRAVSQETLDDWKIKTGTGDKAKLVSFARKKHGVKINKQLIADAYQGLASITVESIINQYFETHGTKRQSERVAQVL